MRTTKPLAAALLVLTLALPALPVSAQGPAKQSATPLAPAKLSAEHAAEVKRAEEYLGGIKTMRSQFLQVSDDGSVARGTFSLSRPGRMRIDFDPPSQNFIVADGSFVYFWDAEIKEQSNAPIGSTMADFLLRPDLRLSGDVVVTKVEKGPGAVEITLAQAKDPGLGRLTLVFEDRPYSLRKWRVLDAQGLTTEVALQNPEFGVSLDKDLFVFRNPERRKERD